MGQNSAQQLGTILINNKGVTKKVLRAAIDLVSIKLKGKTGRENFTEFLLSLPLADEEIIWELIKKSRLEALNCVIQHANKEMLKWVEENRPSGKLRQAAIDKRRKILAEQG